MILITDLRISIYLKKLLEVTSIYFLTVKYAIFILFSSFFKCVCGNSLTFCNNTLF